MTDTEDYSKIEVGKSVIHINPPPSDRRCECCGKHVNELPAYGGAGDPVVGDFKGAKLVKNYRPMYPRDTPEYEEYSKIWGEEYAKQGNDYEKTEAELVKRHGKEKVEGWNFLDQLVNTVEASWECRNCICLGGADYHEKKWKRINEEQKNADAHDKMG